jgi:hypothetical protein
MAKGGLVAPRLLRPAWVRWLALAALLTLLIGSALVWLAGADTTAGQILILTERPVALHSDQSLGQTFHVLADDFHSLDLLFATNAEARSRTVRLIISDLRGQRLVDQEIVARRLRDGWYRFTFPPLRGVAGVPLRLEVERDAPARAAVALWVGPGNAYPGQGIFAGEIDGSFDLAFRAYSATAPTPTARLARAGELAAALATGRPGLVGQPAFLLVLGALYVAGLAMVSTILIAHRHRP